jgi:hypothetical protein
MLTRRKLLKSGAATGLALATPGLFAPAIAQGAKIRIGYVSPQTGPLAGFAESDAYNIEAFLAPGGRPARTSRSSSRTASPTRTAPPPWRRN